MMLFIMNTVTIQFIYYNPKIEFTVQGCKKNQYTQYYYLQTLLKIGDIDYSLDEMIYDRLKLKEHIMLEAVDDGKLERVFTEQEDIDAIFQKLNI